MRMCSSLICFWVSGSGIMYSTMSLVIKGCWKKKHTHTLTGYFIYTCTLIKMILLYCIKFCRFETVGPFVQGKIRCVLNKIQTVVYKMAHFVVKKTWLSYSKKRLVYEQVLKAVLRKDESWLSHVLFQTKCAIYNTRQFVHYLGCVLCYVRCFVYFPWNI